MTSIVSIQAVQATVDAIHALLTKPSDEGPAGKSDPLLRISLGGNEISPAKVEAGTHVFETSVRVQHAGVYQSGIAEIRCMYAPEFHARSGSVKLEVVGPAAASE